MAKILFGKISPGDGYGDGYGYGYGDGNGEYWSGVIAAAIDRNPNKDRAETLSRDGCRLAIWRSNQNGTPANGGKGTVAAPGLVETIDGPLELCTARALHATLSPEKWKGERYWVVALYPPIAEQEDKMGSLKREILFELE